MVLKHVNETTIFLNFITFLTYVSKPLIWQLNDQRIAIFQDGLLVVSTFYSFIFSVVDYGQPTMAVNPQESSYVVPVAAAVANQQSLFFHFIINFIHE